MKNHILRAIGKAVGNGSPIVGLLAGAVAMSGCDSNRSTDSQGVKDLAPAETNQVEETDEFCTMGELLPDEDFKDPDNSSNECAMIPTAGLLPASAEVPKPSGVVSNGLYVVQEGDDLTSVSIRFSMSMQRLRFVNSLKAEEELQPGTRLLVEIPMK